LLLVIALIVGAFMQSRVFVPTIIERFAAIIKRFADGDRAGG